MYIHLFHNVTCYSQCFYGLTDGLIAIPASMCFFVARSTHFRDDVVRKSWEFSPLPWLSSVSSSEGLMWVRGQYSSRACSSSPPRFTAAQHTHSELIFIIICHRKQTAPEARLTFRVGSVRAGEASVFSRNPGCKAVALVQRYRQHLSNTSYTINETFTEDVPQHMSCCDAPLSSDPPKTSSAHKPSWTFSWSLRQTPSCPSLQLYRPATQRSGHMTDGSRVEGHACKRYLQHIPVRHVIVGVFGQNVSLVVQNVALNYTGAT